MIDRGLAVWLKNLWFMSDLQSGHEYSWALSFSLNTEEVFVRGLASSYCNLAGVVIDVEVL